MRSRFHRSLDPRDSVKIDGDRAFVELTKKKVAVIDAGDAELVGRRFWSANLRDGIWYAANTGIGQMHRHILGVTGPETYVDHIDGDGLNNRRANLRVCSNQQNSFNRKVGWAAPVELLTLPLVGCTPLPPPLTPNPTRRKQHE